MDQHATGSQRLHARRRDLDRVTGTEPRLLDHDVD